MVTAGDSTGHYIYQLDCRSPFTRFEGPLAGASGTSMRILSKAKSSMGFTTHRAGQVCMYVHEVIHPCVWHNR